MRKRAKLLASHIPVVVVCGSICVLYAGALVGVLLPTVWFITVAGLVLLLAEVVLSLLGKSLFADLRGFITPGFLLFLGLCTLFLFFTRGPMAFLGDGYNHWATVVKLMCHTNHLPRPENTIIIFQSYPPGSSLFLYYFNRVTGFSEANMMRGQFVMTFAALASLFSVVERAKKSRAFFPLIIALGWCYVILAQNELFELLVDGLMPAFALAAATVMLHYRDVPLRAAAISAPMQVACMLTKNSGLFFVAANTGILFIIFLKAWHRQNSLRQPRKKEVWTAALLMLLPYVALLLWNAHVDATFPAGALSYHAMRAERLGGNLALHTPREMQTITQIFFSALPNVQRNPHILALLVWVLVLVALGVFWRKTQPKQAAAVLKWALFACGVYVLYMAGLYGTYVTSMPYYEAVDLASFSRYSSSVYIYLSGVLAWVLMDLFIGARGASQRAVALGLVVPLLWGLAIAQPKRLMRRPYAGTSYQYIDEQIAQLGVDRGDYSYFAIGQGEGLIAGGTTEYYLKYKLLANNVLVKTPAGQSASDFLQQMEKFDYLLVLEDGPEVEALFSGYSHFQSDETHVGLYRLPLQ